MKGRLGLLLALSQALLILAGCNSPESSGGSRAVPSSRTFDSLMVDATAGEAEGRNEAWRRLSIEHLDALCDHVVHHPALSCLVTSDYPREGGLLLVPSLRDPPSEVTNRVDQALEKKAVESPSFALAWAVMTETLYRNDGRDPLEQHVLLLLKSPRPGLRRAAFEWLRAYATFPFADYPWDAETEEQLKTKHASVPFLTSSEAKLRAASDRAARVRLWLESKPRR